MHITADARDSYTILHLRGEFDTFYCPLLEKEINALVAGGTSRVVLNLRLVKFINSTALGAIIKASKTLQSQGGHLVISRPSNFCRDIIAKVGLNRVVPMFDTDEEAAAHLTEDVAADADGEEFPGEEEGAVMFSPTDPSRVEHFVPAHKRGGGRANPVHGHSFGKTWRGIGRMSDLSSSGLSFTWNGGSSELSPFEMAQFLAIGTDLKVKFRLPLFQKGHCEAVVTVTAVDEGDEDVRIGTSFQQLDDETRSAVEQYAKDMAYLRKELKRATE